jgi:hypothetical protein
MAVCDPRVAAAQELKRKRTPSLVKLATARKVGSSKASDRLEYCGHVRARPWVANDVDSDQCGDDESEDEMMDVEEASQLGQQDEGLLAEHLGGIDYTFGAALLLLRQHLARLLVSAPKIVEVQPVVTKAIVAADGALELALSLVADQTMYNPDFRTRSTSSRLLKPSTASLGELDSPLFSLFELTWSLASTQSRLTASGLSATDCRLS